MKQKWILALAACMSLGLLSTAVASDVGMIGEDGSESAPQVVLMGEGSSYTHNAEKSDQSEGFVHVDAGMNFRNVQNDSGLFCLDTTPSSFGTACSSSQSWKHAKSTFAWSVGLGFRYNAAFSLDFAYWGMQKQSANALTTTSHLSLRTWMVSALYQAQVKLFSDVFLMPQVGVVYITNTARGVNNSATVHARTINWRPAIGLGILWSFAQDFGLNLSGIYIPEAGHSPTMHIRYPSMQLVTLGLRYAF
jgi:hypothetical protein